MEQHHIHRQTIELHVPREEGTETLRAQTADAIEAAFLQCFDEVVARVVGPRSVHLSQLTLDLGRLDALDAPELVPEVLEKALESALEKALEEGTIAEMEDTPDAWRTFLNTGNLPWDAPERNLSTIQQLFAEHGRLPRTLEHLCTDSTALLRVLRHMPDATLLSAWLGLLPHPLSHQALTALLQALPSTEASRLAFWQAVLRLGHTPGPESARLATLAADLLRQVPGTWQQKSLPKDWPTASGPAQAHTWETLAPKATTSPKPTQTALIDWLSIWQDLLKGPIAEVPHLQKILEHLRAGKPHLLGTPLQRSLADLSVLVQGRLRQRQRQQRGLTAEVLSTLQRLIDALSATDEAYWQPLRTALHEAIPGFRQHHADHEHHTTMEWLRATLAWLPPVADHPLVAPWRAWAYRTGQLTAAQWQQQHAELLNASPLGSLLRQWTTDPKATGTILPGLQPLANWARHILHPWPSPPPTAPSALVDGWQAYVQQGQPLSTTALQALSEPDQATVQAWLRHSPLPNLEHILPLMAANPIPEAGPAHQQLREWLHLHQHVPESQVQQELRPELHYLQQEIQQHLKPSAERPKKVAEGLPEYYLNTGGLVLLWPFIRPLFTHLQLIDAEAKFISPEHQAKAVMVLYTLATGLHSAAEPELPLCKVLAGLPAEAPVPVTWEPTEADLAEMEQLLTSALQPSERLSSSGTASFRGNFLLREAVLRSPSPNWVLDVERKPYDLLLSSLPWQWSIIKLPWLPEIIHVTWGG